MQTRPWNRSSQTNWLNSTENRSIRSIDSTLVDSVDRLRWKSIDSIDSFPTVYRLIHFSLRNFSWAACFSSSCLFVCHHHVLCSWLLDNSQTCRLARSPDPCAKTTGRIELQFGVLIGLGQCHFALDGCPIPNRPSVMFPGKGQSWSFFAALYLANGSSRRMVKIEHYPGRPTNDSDQTSPIQWLMSNK